MKKYIGMVLLVISLVYSIEFYLEIALSFAIFIIAFEICKLILLRQEQTLKVKLICITCSMFVIFGFVSNTINKLEISNLKQYKKVTNEQYIKYLEDKKMLEKQVEEAKNQLNSYPTFESLGLTKWEDKTESYKNWNNQKNALNSNYNKLITDLNKLQKPNKFIRVKIKNTGFNNLFYVLKLPKKEFLLVLSIIISLIMELLQYEFMKNKESKLAKSKSEISDHENISDQIKSETQTNENIIIENENIETLDNSNIGWSENKSKSEISDQSLIQECNSIETLDDSNIDKSEISDYEKISDYLRLNYRPNEKIKKFQSEFNLKISDYRKIMKRLKDEDIIYTKDRNTYLKENKLIRVK